MNRNELKDILQSGYDQGKWIKILQFITGNKNLLNINLEARAKVLKSAKAESLVRELVELGTLKTTDGAVLPIYDVTLVDDLKIEYNRVGVNDLLKQFILKDAHKGAIVTFHYRKDFSKKEWRFSFISKNPANDFFAEIEGPETTPKKYTYIFGTGEEHRTAIERIYNLEQSRFRMEDFFEAFNVEPVSNNFFKEYKNYYQDFVDAINIDKESRKVFEKPNLSEEEVEKDIRNFVKRLLGRIVFLYFLQKKRWLGASDKNYEDGDTNFLQNLFSHNESSKENFYNKWLSKLFFEALNTPNRTNDQFELSNGVIRCVPFLNGGLFEEQQEPEGHRNLKIPVFLFENLFNFFNGYNFTIYENSPDDHTVAVDPEMLGHIFENLLEDNKDKGAFYTPKEIVQYMTQESLIEYLSTHVSHSRKTIEELVKNHSVNNLSREDLKQIKHYIDVVKICDPAIGSGAFPMGLLQEIFGLKALIHYELGYDVWSPAKIKQDIIQNSIYGVDIEEGAVDIARLRFWLSLVVDEPKPKPLPNLDYKIMQGNSLLESFEGVDLSNLDLFNSPSDQHITLFEEPKVDYRYSEDIKQLMDNYFNPKNYETKQLIHKEIDKKVNDFIDKCLEGYENRLLIELAGAKQTLKRKKELKQKTDSIEKEIEKIENQLTNKSEARNKLLGFELNQERPYFLWQLYFADVFDKGGFDIVIGNPPYIQLQKNGGLLANIYKDEGFKTFERTGDIYSLFYEKGIDILKADGIITYITSRQWMRSSYGESLRSLFNKYNPLTLLDLGSGVFNNATVDTNIILLQKTSNKNTLMVVGLENKKEIPKLDKKDFIPLKINNNEPWTILNKNQLFIKSQIEKYGTPLKEWDINVYRGILTGFNDAFIISKEEKDKLISKDKNSINIIKPLIRGRDLKKYVAEKSDLSIINSHNGYTKGRGSDTTKIIESINIDDFPAIKEHFDKTDFSLKLEKRQDKGKTKYNLRNCAYIEDFYKEKIAWASVGATEYCFIEKDTFLLDTNYFLTFKNNNKIDKYLLGVLNSKLIISWVNNEDTQVGTVAYRHYKYNFERIPIPKIEDYRKETIRLLTEFIVYLKKNETIQINSLVKNNHIANFFEEVIDGCVFELYFEEHMKEKNINIIDDVKNLIQTSGLVNDFDKINVGVKNQKIWELYKEMSKGVVQIKMTDFITKSPEILKLILQS
ncbi:MAG: Eco57I restriction-modification methylase domain-containing protein [Flavobacteriaceae bacterium]|nr:Eco57I restriction-modification methylase domain-containing protein [Flavobacteriaceae bacterium]